MTTLDLIALAGEHWAALLVWFVAIPMLAALVGMCHKQGRGGARPWRYFYSVLVYLACVPGMLAAVLTAYSLFIVRQNLLEANLFVYALPILSMGVTLIAIGARVNFNEVPGFDRVSGLMALVATTFVIVLAIEKTRIWLFFAGSMISVIGLLLVVFVLLKWGANTLLRRADTSQVKQPPFPT